MNIIGISAYYHDSAAALISDGIIVAAAQEERFTRIKHDPTFPKKSIEYCLKEANLTLDQLDYIVFYDKPLLKFDRLVKTYIYYSPNGFHSFLRSISVWIKGKIFLKSQLKNELSLLSGISIRELPDLVFTEHHQSHAASAFYPSPYDNAAVLCLDGVGEWATSSVWLGNKEKLTLQWQIDFPHSLGLLYSAFTYYAGFRVNSGEYKLMGLAPYGKPKYVDLILEKLIDIKEDGTFHLDMSYFNYAVGATMISKKFEKLFGGPSRVRESKITQKEMDIAKSIQVVTEEIVLRISSTIHKELKVDFLCLAGGVALNCVANGRVLREGPFKDIWIQPAAGDAGGALGAALAIWNEKRDSSVEYKKCSDMMRGSYLGIEYSNSSIKSYLDSINAIYSELSDSRLLPKLANILKDENVVGWFNGRMEFGPRALGARSIIGDPRSSKMQSIMNLKIKYRESFRPFAPAIKYSRVSDWFEIDRPSPYMLFVAPVNKAKIIFPKNNEQKSNGIDKINDKRSVIPAITHVDYSARIQTVHKSTNPRFYSLINEFEKITECPILINTSFNVRGEPIVCSPEDAYRCFMNNNMDYLVMENIFLSKNDQLKQDKDSSWMKEFPLD